MKSNLISLLLFLLAAVPVAVAGEQSLPDLLNELDQAIANREEFLQQKEDRIESLKQLRRNAKPSTAIELTERIVNEYHSFRTDSAIVYAKELLKLASNPRYGHPEMQQSAVIELANCYSVYGDYNLADSTLRKLQGEVTTENKSKYYNAVLLLYVWRAEYARLNETRANYYHPVLALRDSVLKYEHDPILRMQQHSLITLDSDAVAAKNELRMAMAKIKDKDEYIRYLSNSLASCYKQLEMPDSAQYFYALSALSDIRMGVQEHSSLRELALLLFGAGDVKRAYEYTNCCLEDAKACGAQLRMMQMAGDMPVIMNNYQNLVNEQKRDLRLGLVLLSVFLVVLATFLFYMFRVTRKLHRTQKEIITVNKKLKQSRAELETSYKQMCVANEHLRQANDIKESFVSQYMKQCIKSLEQLENYRHALLRLASSGASMNKIIETLRDASISEKEHKVFLKNFDESFLKLFPTFVVEFNNLLIPEERIVLTEEKHMNTELRIYALIRLGITESEDIGNFIGKSVKTVYNYRARMRNKAAGDRDQFDNDVQQLCLMSQK